MNETIKYIYLPLNHEIIQVSLMYNVRLLVETEMILYKHGQLIGSLSENVITMSQWIDW